MSFPHHRTQPGLLHAVRIAGDAARTHSDCWFVGVEHTLHAIRACRARDALFRTVEILSAKPCRRDLYNLARDAAQEPAADGESLRHSLEGLAVLTAAGRMPELHALIRAELGAEYVIVR